MKIEIVNAVHAKAAIGGRGEIWNLLSYDVEYWHQGEFAKVKDTGQKSFMDARNGVFYSGFVPKIADYFQRQNKPLQIVSDASPVMPLPPGLVGIEFKEKQRLAIMEAIREMRGVIKFATGTGKTVIAAGIISCFPKIFPTLFLVHSIDILRQAHERFLQYGLRSVIVKSSSKEKDIRDMDVICCSIQSLKKVNDNLFLQGKIKAIIVDECHHIAKRGGGYDKQLAKFTQTYYRIGLTGTLPRTKEGRLLLEGVIGPVLAELKMKEAVKDNLLTPPKVQLIPVKKKTEIADLYRYAELYDAAVVKNKIRNLKAVRRAQQHISKGRSVLMIVQKIKHGEEIVKSGIKLGLPITFVNGSTAGVMRKQIMSLFEQKQIRCVVCTDVWREGVDIPSLDVLVNLAGGKSEVRTIQGSGRTMRRAKGKQRAIIVDFLDPYKYLAEHAIMRIQIYVSEGML